MELANVDFGPERRLRLVSQAADGQLAELVGEGLAANSDVALDLGGEVGKRHPLESLRG